MFACSGYGGPDHANISAAARIEPTTKSYNQALARYSWGHPLDRCRSIFCSPIYLYNMAANNWPTAELRKIQWYERSTLRLLHADIVSYRAASQ